MARIWLLFSFYVSELLENKCIQFKNILLTGAELKFSLTLELDYHNANAAFHLHWKTQLPKPGLIKKMLGW